VTRKATASAAACAAARAAAEAAATSAPSPAPSSPELAGEVIAGFHYSGGSSVIGPDGSVMYALPAYLRPGADGRLVPRNIVHTFSCRYDGAEVFRAELHPAITANPYLAFTTIATRSGPLEFRWEDDRGEVIVATATIVVE
jgi:sulfur-oxidizing protein SoxZ